MVGAAVCAFGQLKLEGAEPMTRDRALQYLLAAPGPPAHAEIFSPPMVAGFWIGSSLSHSRFLSKLPNDVEPELVALTTNDRAAHVRCRGMIALSMRSSEKGIRMAGEWIRSADRTQRYFGWWALRLCPAADAIYSVVPPHEMVELYRTETCSYVRREIEGFFAQHKAGFAVEALCDIVLDTTYPASWRDSAADCLGAIGDVRAIDALVQSHASPLVIVPALGELEDERGAEYVIRYLRLPGAPVALARIGGERAVPALQNELQRLARREVPEGVARDGYLENHAYEVRLALLLLQSEDVHGDLLGIAEDPTIDPMHRELAIGQLERIGIGPVFPRFLDLYRSLMPTKLGENCLRVVKRDPSVDATNAMKEHFAVLRRIRAAGGCERSGLVGKSLLFVESGVEVALHERIGNDVFALENEPCVGKPQY